MECFRYFIASEHDKIHLWVSAFDVEMRFCASESADVMFDKIKHCV